MEAMKPSPSSTEPVEPLYPANGDFPLHDQVIGMMKVRFFSLFFCVFFLLPGLFPELCPAADPARVFIVHSYDAENVCGKPQETGLMEGLAEQGLIEGKNLDVKRYYMRTKRIHTTPEQIRLQARSALESIDQWQPDVVVTLDDNATREVMLPLVDSGLPVVFSGINNPPEFYNNQKTFMETRKKPGHNVTGVYEKLHVAKSLQVMKEIIPDLRRIVVLVDGSPTGCAIHGQVERELSGLGGDVSYSFWFARDFAEYKRMIYKINSTPSIGAYYSACSLLHDIDGVVTVPEIAAWGLAHAKKPDMAVNFSVTRLGYFGGASVDFTGIGRQVSAMVAAILKGGKAGDIPIEEADDYAIVFNLARARQLGVSIPPDILGAADQVYDTMELGGELVQPLVLIIHSWKKDYEETALERGIFLELEKAGWVEGKTFKTRRFWLDVDSASSQGELRERAESILKEVRRDNPHALVVLGDAATTEVMLPLTGSTYPVLFGGIYAPLSFYRQRLGLSEDKDFLGQNVTGVQSVFNYVQTLRSLRLILPDSRRIAVVSSDAWPWLEAINEYFLARIREYRSVRELADLDIHFEKVSTLEEFQEAILRLNADPDIDIISALRPVGLTRKDGSKVSLSEVIEWLFAHQHKPDFALLASWVRSGFLVSAAVDPEEVGQQLGQQLIRIFAGDTPAMIPIEYPAGKGLFLNQARARELGTRIPVDIYEAAREIYVTREPVFEP